RLPSHGCRAHRQNRRSGVRGRDGSCEAGHGAGVDGADMKRDRHAYVVVLPSLFTTGNLFCGFYSLIKSIQGDFVYAALLILFAGIFDALDGRVARITRSQTRFGVEYDSISDVLSFATAPAMLAYLWA